MFRAHGQTVVQELLSIVRAESEGAADGEPFVVNG
ncbi:hypothetical protein JOF35_008686 [Streptomyces demainii]|uniref:Uncharacterized protein n=1 Tax=Streptomyces demainii TaxID=588122 RepID=A0ABT9L6L2_9ACTN|nr:hypothetical protein [Streptomyces demainii]